MLNKSGGVMDKIFVTSSKWAKPGMMESLKNILSTAGGRGAVGAAIGGVGGAAHGVGAGDDATGVLAKSLAGAGTLGALGYGADKSHILPIVGGAAAGGAGLLGWQALKQKQQANAPKERYF